MKTTFPLGVSETECCALGQALADPTTSSIRYLAQFIPTGGFAAAFTQWVR